MSLLNSRSGFDSQFPYCYGDDNMTLEDYNNNPNICLYCGKPILRNDTKKIYDTKKKKFCNHSCSAKYNNSKRQKKQYFCVKCGNLIGEGEKFARKQLCEECNPNNIDWNKITYGEMKAKRNYQVNSRIRELARTAYLKNNLNPKCEICGYDKHVEVHHIKGISTFSDDTPIAEINTISNLIGLCPNHHWEIENGLINL